MCVDKKICNPDLYFNGLSRGIEYGGSTVDFRAFDFFEGVINALLGYKKTKSKG